MRLSLKHGGRALVSLLCSLVLVFSVFPAHAEDKEDLESKTSNLQNQLAGINQELLTISDEISIAEMQIKITDSEILRTKDSLIQAEANESKQYDEMKVRIKYMYETGNSSLLEMLFTADNMADFLNKADFIQNISNYDRDMLKELQKTQEQIAAQKDTMEAQQTAMQNIQKDLESRQAELVAKANETSTDLNAFKAQLEQLRAEEAARLAAEAAAREAAAKEVAANTPPSSSTPTPDNNGGGEGNTTPDDSGGYDDSVVNGGASNVSGSDLDILAAILQCEAYQDYDSLLAVATVIMNRVADPRFPNTITDVVYAGGQFEPVWSGRLDQVLSQGPTSLSYSVAQDAINGARLAAVQHCYYFLYAGATNNAGVNIGNNLFFASW